jgi:hypothetical protein
MCLHIVCSAYRRASQHLLLCAKRFFHFLREFKAGVRAEE